MANFRLLNGTAFQILFGNLPTIYYYITPFEALYLARGGQTLQGSQEISLGIIKGLRNYGTALNVTGPYTT